MQNIELKAKYKDLVVAEKIAREIGATFEGTFNHIDTYFNVKNGRLKLREINSEGSQLIFYERPDRLDAKLSNYQIHPVSDPAQLKRMLESAVGIWCVVEKRRKLYCYDEVRIHLDSVKNLGSFIEFEGVLMKEHKSETTNKVNWLITQFNISKIDFIDGSYSDLIND
ncbi:CYTH domain-containing protein [candidate division KSB1 bacterium]|nr:CYTH domain-containing protein [candidate division KSB1 bacterium]